MNSKPEGSNLTWLFLSFIFVTLSLISQSQSISELPSVCLPLLSGLNERMRRAPAGPGMGQGRLPISLTQAHCPVCPWAGKVPGVETWACNHSVLPLLQLADVAIP